MSTVDKLWEFARRDLEVRAFERWLYSALDVEDILGADVYFELIEANYGDKYIVTNLRDKLLHKLYIMFNPKCKCLTLKMTSIIPMGDEAEYGLKNFKVVRYHTPSSYLATCETCSQNWFIVEEFNNDDYHCLRLTPDQAEAIMNNKWPTEFDHFEAWTSQDFLKHFVCSQAEWQLRTNQPTKYLENLEAKTQTIDLSNSLIKPRDFKLLNKFTSLTSLNISGTSITDDIFMDLACLQSIAELDLANTKLTDKSLNCLGRLQQLKSLNISGTQLSGDCLFSQNLRTLCAFQTKFSNNALAKLSNCPLIKDLTITDTEVTDVSMGNITAFDMLEVLNIGGLPITDQGFSHIEACNHLRQLSAIGTNITSSSIPIITKLNKLEFLGLSRSGISKSDFGHIIKTLPKISNIY